MTCQPHRGFVLQWHVTERCNLRCAHCYQDACPANELSFDACIAVLDQLERLLDRLGLERGHVTLTGGEPFLRLDFVEILRALARRRARLSFAVLTNGTLIHESLADELAALEPAYVQVSIEGTEKTHDGIRGAGSFARATRGLRHLIQRGMRTMLSFTAHRDNWREFADVARLGRELGVARVWCDRLIPCGAGAALAPLSPEETRALFELMVASRGGALRRRFGRTEIAMHRALQFLEGGGRPYRCSAGRSLITLMSDGELVPCRRMPIRVGSVTERDLADLYFESELFVQLRDDSRAATGCEGCLFSRACHGGLRCLAHATTGNWRNADPGCWLANAHPAGLLQVA